MKKILCAILTMVLCMAAAGCARAGEAAPKVTVTYDSPLPEGVVEIAQYQTREYDYLILAIVYENQGSETLTWDAPICGYDAAGEMVTDDFHTVSALPPGARQPAFFYLPDPEAAVVSVGIDVIPTENYIGAVQVTEDMMQIQRYDNRRNVCLEIQPPADYPVIAHLVLVCFDEDGDLVYVSGDQAGSNSYPMPGDTIYLCASAEKDLAEYGRYETLLYAYGYPGSDFGMPRHLPDARYPMQTYLFEKNGNYSAVTVVRNESDAAHTVYCFALAYDSEGRLAGVDDAMDEDLRFVKPGETSAVWFTFGGAADVQRVEVIAAYSNGRNMVVEGAMEKDFSNSELACGCSVNGDTAEVTLTNNSGWRIRNPYLFVIFFDGDHNAVDYVLDTRLGGEDAIEDGAAMTLSYTSSAPFATAEAYLETWHEVDLFPDDEY